MNFELLVGRPSGSPLFEDYLDGAESAAPFYSGSWQDPKTYRALLDTVDARFDSDARRRALGALTIPEGLDPERLDAGREYKGDDKTPLEQISSGLGWVVHFLQCVCKYLDLVPPHPMKFWGSKSSVAGHDGTEYDLVADGNGIKQDTFKVAMRLLNTNVCWLCGLAGAMPPHGKETRLLENLKRLSEAARLGWSAPPPALALPLDDCSSAECWAQGGSAACGPGAIRRGGGGL